MKKFLYRAARIKFFGTLAGLMIAYLPFFVPLKRIKVNKKIFAAHHPAPSRPDHALIVPRKIARDVFSLSPDDFRAAIEAAAAIRGGGDGFTLMINGGERQDVAQAHFHLFTGRAVGGGGIKIRFPVDETLKRPDEYASKRPDECASKRPGENASNLPGGLRGLLAEHSVPEDSFSLAFWFDGAAEPEFYIF